MIFDLSAIPLAECLEGYMRPRLLPGRRLLCLDRGCGVHPLASCEIAWYFILAAVFDVISNKY